MQQQAQNSGNRGGGGTVRVSLTATGPVVEAQLVARPHALVIEAVAFGRPVRAFLADGVALRDVLRPGLPLLLAPREDQPRRPAYQVVAVRPADDWLSLDPQLAQRLTAAALTQGALPQFARYAKVSRDVVFGNRQIAFRLGDGPLGCLLEVRGTSRLDGRIARYPEQQADVELTAQLDVMTAVARTGQRAALLFMIQRSQCDAFAPADDVDTAFVRAFRTARASGVEVYAYRTPLTPAGIALGDDVPVFASREAIPSSQWES